MTKTTKAFAALILGGVILSTAALASFATSNGYNVYKQSIRNLFEQDNYTASLSAEVYFDDELLYKGTMDEKYDKASNSFYQKETSYDKTWKDNEEHAIEQYFQDGIYVSNNHYNKYTTNEPTLYADDVNIYWHNVDPTFSKEAISNDEPELFDKYFKFAESIADMAVGDIKNNFVMTNSSDGLTTYEVNLDLFQIPEFINTGADVIVSSTAKDYEDTDFSDTENFESYITKFKTNPFVSGAKCIVTVDDNCRLTENILSADISGKDSNGTTHTMTYKIHIAMSDFGTTVPDRIDLDGKDVSLQSSLNRKRISELENILASKDLGKNARLDYEAELIELKNTMEYFDNYGPIDRSNPEVMDKIYNDEYNQKINSIKSEEDDIKAIEAIEEKTVATETAEAE